MCKDMLQSKKRYLTGIDWFIQVFDYMNKQLTGEGHIFQIVVELEGHVDNKNFEEDLKQFIDKFPVLKGKTARGFNLAPYWKLGSANTPLHTGTSYVNNKTEVLPCIENLKHKHSYLSCHFVFLKNTTFIALTFDHRIFDGLGGELFLKAFQEFFKNKLQYSCDVNFSAPAHLSQWRKKFEAGKVVNRAFLKIRTMKPAKAIQIPHQNKIKNKFRFKVITFSPQESKEIINKANSDAGYLLLMPYLLANTIMFMNKVFVNHGIDQGTLVVPVTIDMRSSKKTVEDMFFNHLSFLFFKIDSEEITDLSVLINLIKQQLYDQVKEGFSEKFRETALLMRILPVPLLGRVMGLYIKKKMTSFCFSYLGNSVYTHTHLLDKQVKNIFHMPRAAIPPGIGIFYHQFNGRINATVSYLDGMLTEEDLNIIMDDLRALPLNVSKQ